jgi:23S rRNA (pseudouridine1915-N3)-methyltransferase
VSTIHVVAVGRVSHPALRAACDDYLERIRKVWSVEVHEARSPTGRFAPGERMRREGDRLLAIIPPEALSIALTRAGRSESSQGFARRLSGWQQTHRDIAFVIGGADGLDRRVHHRCGEALSLSSMTLPHELARLVLLEQLYRASTIRRGTPYHKGE